MYNRQKRYGKLKAMICNVRNSASRSQHFVEQNHKHMEFSFILITLIFLPDRFDNPVVIDLFILFFQSLTPRCFFFPPPGFCSRQRFGNYGYARGASTGWRNCKGWKFPAFPTVWCVKQLTPVPGQSKKNHSGKPLREDDFGQWLFLVPLKGGIGSIFHPPGSARTISGK